MINENFENYYSNLYCERWKTLRESLLRERPLYSYSQNLKTPYYMDYSSVLAARLLVTSVECEVWSEFKIRRKLDTTHSTLVTNKHSSLHTILDACAAPGGKSLVIVSGLPSDTVLLSNELSADRRRRLCDVLDKHLHPENRAKVKVCGFDAAAVGRKKDEHNRFTAILLDAPCSSESHVLKDEKAYAAWTPARPKFLAQRQWSLLSSMFLLLSPGGCLVYCTCAITKVENDGVVERLFIKYKDKAELVKPDFKEGEETAYGKIILPDRDGIGPLYVAKIVKKCII